MKSIKRTTEENPRKVTATIIASIVAVATLFVDQAELLGVDVELIKWVSFGIAAVTAVISIVNSNTKK